MHFPRGWCSSWYFNKSHWQSAQKKIKRPKAGIPQALVFSVHGIPGEQGEQTLGETIPCPKIPPQIHSWHSLCPLLLVSYLPKILSFQNSNTLPSAIFWLSPSLSFPILVLSRAQMPGISIFPALHEGSRASREKLSPSRLLF